MAEKNNAICSVCGSPYHKCLSCRDSMNLKPWQVYCCSSNCYKIFQAVRGYNTNVYTKDELKSKLKNVDLRGLENYKEPIKVLIKETLKEDEPIVAETVTIDEPVVKALSSRKRNYKSNNVEVE